MIYTELVQRFKEPLMTTLPTLGLTSSSTQSAAPFTFGQAFVQGSVPAGSNAVAPNAQVVPKNKWPDGSLKFAIVSGTAALAANVPTMLTFTLGTPPNESTLTTANLVTTKMSASISAGAFGTVVWNSADWSTPFMAWVSGPEMSSWIYRKTIGTDAHLVGWLEVRLYKSGAVEILPWIENGYLTVAAPVNKSATYSFAINGVGRFSAVIDLPNHCRTPLVSGTALSYWLGADPSVTPSHGGSLQLTGLVPTYGARANFTTIARQAQTYTPLQQSNYPNGMGAAGYHPSIGVLPEWDAAYLTTDDAKAYRGLLVNNFSAGRFGIHYRDETTNRPLKFSAYPHLVMGKGSSVPGTGAATKNTFTPSATGTLPSTYNSTHHPSMGFTAYLVTGRFYFMEQLQFCATANFLKNQDNNRQFSNGVFLTNAGSNTTRGAAWAIRTLAQVASITPDDDALRPEFINSMAANVDYYHALYVAQPNNPQGFVRPYSNYTEGKGKYSEAAWMQDFFTAATGYAISLAVEMPSISVKRLSEFFVWKAKSIVGRLGGSAPTDYLYRDAAVYAVPVAPTDTPDFIGGTGPWYENWGVLYAATNRGADVSSGDTLRGGNFPEATSYWGNLQPAIAYAVEHNVPGAVEANSRMTSATNFDKLQAGMPGAITWSVVAKKNAPLESVPPVLVPVEPQTPTTPPEIPPAVPAPKLPPVAELPIVQPIAANFTITLPAPKDGSVTASYKITLNDGTVLEQTLPVTGKPMRLRVIIEEQL